MARRCRCPEFLLLGCLLLTGCSGEPAYHPVSGRLTLDGAPVAQAAVMFHPRASGPVGSAVTDAEGKFSVRAANRDGLPPGDYTITVTKQRTVGVEVGEDGLEKAPGSDVRIEWVVPEKYSTLDSSGLTASVPVATAVYELKLDSK